MPMSSTAPDHSALSALDGASVWLNTEPLTSVRIDYAQFGEVAAASLLAAIAGEEPPPYVAPAPELVVRGSTGPA